MSQQGREGITRRGFLQAGGFVLVSVSAPELFLGCGSPGPDSPPGEDVRFRIVRPEDLFVADLGLFNLRRQGTKFVRKNANQSAYVVVYLPCQHILERTVDEGSDAPQPPVESRLSGPTRLVFKAPDGVQEFEGALSALLEAITNWDLGVAVNAAPPPGLEPKSGRFLWVPSERPIRPLVPKLIQLHRQRQQSRILTFHLPGLVPLDNPGDLSIPKVPSAPAEPSDLETSIELPYRLLMSPNGFARFAHAAEPVTSSAGRVELWHTRLATRTAAMETDERRKDLRTMRALWVRGQPFDPNNVAAPTSGDNDPFPASLTAADRNGIVHASSNFNLAPTPPPSLSNRGGSTHAYSPWGLLGCVGGMGGQARLES